MLKEMVTTKYEIYGYSPREKVDEFKELVESLKELAEEGKGLLNLFGTHTYTVTLDCTEVR